MKNRFWFANYIKNNEEAIMEVIKKDWKLIGTVNPTRIGKYNAKTVFEKNRNISLEVWGEMNKNHFYDGLRYAMGGEVLMESRLRVEKKKVDVMEFYFDRSRRSMVCVVEFEGDQHFGIARLHPLEKPDPVMGRKVALSRAIKKLRRCDREFIWKHYFKKFPGDKEVKRK